MFIRQAHINDAKALAEVQVTSWLHAYKGLIDDSILDNLSVEEKKCAWIKKLENDIGVQLIDRGGRKKMRLTEAGKIFLEGARETLRAAGRRHRQR